MYELDTLKKKLTDIAGLKDTLARLDSSEHIEELRKRYEGSTYAALCGEVLGHATSVATDAQFALRTLERAIAEVALMERLADVMHNEFDISVYQHPVTRKAQTRELELLETLCNSGRYNYERNQLRDCIAKALGEVEEAEREREQEEAIAALTAAGFQAVETDDFEGYERIRDGSYERVTIEMAHDRYHHCEGYKFEYVRDRGTAVETVVEGKSGEFAELLKAAGCEPLGVAK
jgi:hypothetical protein